MPQNTAHSRLSGEISETVRERTEERGRPWLTQLLSDWRVGDRGKLVAAALFAVLRSRHGRTLLRRLLVVSVFFVYEYMIIVEIIAGILLLAEVAARLIRLLTSSAQANRRGRTNNNVSPSTSGNDVSNQSTTSNDGGDRTGPRRGRRQHEAIQSHLQRLAMSAAAADEPETATNVAPSLLPYYQRECVTIEYPERNGTTLAVTTYNTRSNSQATAASPRPRGTSRQTPHSDPDSSTIVSLQNQRNHLNPTEGLSWGLQEPEQEAVVIHLQLPIYVCDLTFWNDIHITLPSLSRPSSPPSGVTTANRGRRGDASDAAGIFYQIKMHMWMELNRDLVAKIGTGSNKKPCKDCLMGSHSVGKRQFDCTYVHGGIDGGLDVNKNTFHAGRKLTILGANSGLNFRFETALEQTPARNGISGPGAVQQRATFALLARKANLKGLRSTNQQQLSKVDGGSSPKRQRGTSFGVLAAVLRTNSNSNSAYAQVAKCSMKTRYVPSSLRLMTEESYTTSQLGTGQNGLDERLLGSTIASSS